MRRPIDIVILWVNDQDLNWQKEKSYWQKKIGKVTSQDERYRDWNNLQYLFRGIEKYAPWVNHIFLVTDDQKPSWLNEKSDKVTIVDHSEIIDEKYLPTYNSHSIELNIHKIEGLSEDFVYFNDDTFIIDETSPEDFFVNGIPKDSAVSNALAPNSNELTQSIMFNNLSIINEVFNKHQSIKSSPFKWFNYKYGLGLFRTIILLPWKSHTGFINPHLCVSYNKKTFEKIWENYETELIDTTQSKFREAYNYNQWLMRYWQLSSNNFIPRRKKFGKNFSITNSNSVEKCVEHITDQKSKVICVNDNELLKNFMQSKKEINIALEVLLPDKSYFEI